MTTRWDAETYDRDFGFVSAYGAQLVDWLAPQPGESVLDLGCGTGELAAQIAARGAQVIAIDSDPAMVDVARRRLPGAEVRLADGHDFTVDPPVDAVFSNAALHWMGMPVEVIGCIRDAVRPGGRFVAEMGAAGNIAAMTQAVEQACAEAGVPAPHWHWFFPTPAEYAALLEDAGFEIRILEHFDRPTRLNGPDGFLEWWQMFAGALVSDLPEGVMARAAEIARPRLWRDDAWWADYRRLRFRAVRVG